MQFGIFSVGDVTPDPTTGQGGLSDRIDRAAGELAALLSPGRRTAPAGTVTPFEAQLAALHRLPSRTA